MHLADFHPIVLHFPIVCFMLALIFDLIGRFGHKESTLFAHWMVLLGVITTIPTLITGWDAGAFHGFDDKYVYWHRATAFITAGLGLINGILRWGILRKRWTFNGILPLSLSVLTAIALTICGDLGGVITRGSTPFQQRASVADEMVRLASVQETSNPSTIQELHSDEDAWEDEWSEEEEEVILPVNYMEIHPILVRYQCAECHSEVFNGDYPQHISTIPSFERIWIERDATGTPRPLHELSLFQEVVIKNSMPPENEENGTTQGMSPEEQLLILRWLNDGAPMLQVTPAVSQ